MLSKVKGDSFWAVKKIKEKWWGTDRKLVICNPPVSDFDFRKMKCVVNRIGSSAREWIVWLFIFLSV